MALKLILTFVGLFIIGYFVNQAIGLSAKASVEQIFYGMPGIIVIIFAWFPWTSNKENPNQEESK